MQPAPASRSNLLFVTLVTLLVAGIAVGVALLAVQLRDSAGSADFATSTPEAVDCPLGSGNPVCYKVDVTNAGSGEAPLRCVISAVGDDVAAFTASRGPVYESEQPVVPGDTYPLYIELTDGGDDVVERPAVACASAE